MMDKFRITKPRTGAPVCSECHCEYDPATGLPGRYLTEAEYRLIDSHSWCSTCGHREIERYKRAKIEAAKSAA